MGAHSEGPYHHGDLPQALRAAGVELLAERGVAGFSLREVARRAGVSHAAPTHHFGDAAGLLTAIAIDAFDLLMARMKEAVKGIDDPVEALVALGRTYVALAIEHPGHYAVALRVDVVHADDDGYREASQAAFGVLRSAVRRVAYERAPDLDVDLASASCWALAQGLLAVQLPLATVAAGAATPPLPELAEAALRLLIDGMAPRPVRRGGRRRS